MARKFIKRYSPDPEWVKNHRSLRFMGTLLHDPNIWHLTRHSVSMAFFVGLFVAFIPLPGQMLIAALIALVLRSNLAISVALVWVTNPLTMPPIFYLAYKVGHAVLGAGPLAESDFEPTLAWIAASLSANWQPFILGCLICGLFFGLLGAALTRGLWRWHVVSRWHARRANRIARK
jgi:hypothetical protein